MEAVFLKLVNMSITASWMILAAILMRSIFKKAPKSLRFAVWALVALRLMFPISLESALSLIPSAEPLPQEILIAPVPQIDSGIPVVNQMINPVISTQLAPAPAHQSEAISALTPMQTLTHIASTVWICGTVLIVGYAIVSYAVLRRRVAAGIKIERGIYICDELDSPFVLGIIRPRIYMPSSLEGERKEHVISHERAHISRRDHWWKPLGFMLLAVYWFNPMIWVAYILLCRDIELACDERVTRKLTDEERAAYSASLLELSIPRRMISACPVAFGEVGVKDRIKSVLSYKKPTLWIIIASVVICSVLAVTLLTDPKDGGDHKNDPEEKQGEKQEKDTDNTSTEEPVQEPEWDQKYVAETSKDAISPYFCLNEDEKSYLFVYSGFSSHVSVGKYTLIDGDILFIEDETGKEYVFRVSEDAYAFDASASAALPEYKYSENSEPQVCLEDGTLFEKEQAFENSVTDEIIEDVTEKDEPELIAPDESDSDPVVTESIDIEPASAPDPNVNIDVNYNTNTNTNTNTSVNTNLNRDTTEDAAAEPQTPPASPPDTENLGESAVPSTPEDLPEDVNIGDIDGYIYERDIEFDRAPPKWMW